MRGEGEMEVHGICNRSLVNWKEVVRLEQAILACGDSTGSN